MIFHAKCDWEQIRTEKHPSATFSLICLICTKIYLERILRSLSRKGVFSICVEYAQFLRGAGLDLA